MSLIEALILLSFITYRVTRFLIDDDLISAQRDWVRKMIFGTTGEPPSRWRAKLLDLLECPYCMSVWIAAATTAAVAWTWSVPKPFWLWLAACGSTMLVWRIVEREE